MKLQHKPVKTLMTKSRLPVSDYAVNPYVGCPHKCRYCYACFMKRFTGHEEPWGEFMDIKQAPPMNNPARYAGQKLFFGSVTDCYNPYEAEFCKTRGLLEQFVGAGADITIATKSDLILRDLDVLQRLGKVTVAISINTLDEGFRADMDAAASIARRIAALKALHEGGIRTVCFISPIFPGITVVEDIAGATRGFVEEYWLENLNLRGGYKQDILGYIAQTRPELRELYEAIYKRGDKAYWITLSERLERYAAREGLNMVNYFYHELIRKP